MGRIIHVNTIIAHHLILHGYGHWLPNDLRGSGSTELRQGRLAEFGPIHFGRKWDQPSLAEIKAFYRDAKEQLAFEPIWFNDEQRRLIGDAFASVVKELGYTVWSCAVMHGHAHLNARIHRDDARTIWMHFAEASQDAIRKLIGVPDHPVWSSRPYAVYQYTPPEVRRVNKYILDNPPKEHLAPQTWDFIRPYDNWPWYKRTPPNPKWR